MSRSVPVVVTALLGAVGPRSAAAQEVLVDAQGTYPSGWLGHAVSGVGDVDGDGVEDVSVGAPYDSSTVFQGGLARVVSGASGATVLNYAPNSYGSRFGSAVAGVGDLDLDGVPDLAVGAPKASISNVEVGMVVVLSGATGGVMASVFGASPFGQTGASLASAGDVDQDGVGDFVVGSPFDRAVGDGAGRVDVISGATGLRLWTAWGSAAGERAGYAVSGGRDVDGDGAPDVAIGRPGHTPAIGKEYAGAIDVRAGATGALLFTTIGQAAQDSVGEAIDLRGDLDGDGRGDILFGMRRRSGQTAPNRGLVRVVSPSTQLTLLSVVGVDAFEEFGTSVAYLGDVDQDGVDDLIAGAPLGGAGGYATGVVRVVSGATHIVSFPVHGQTSPGLFGQAVARVGDLDADGRPDFAVGARRYSAGSPEVGRVVVVSGAGCADGVGYGGGCPGSGGFEPGLKREGCPTPGALMTLSLTRGLGGAPAFFAVGPGAGSAPVGGGCSLLVAAPFAFLGPVPLAGAVPGAGGVVISVSIPPLVAYPDLAVQAWVVDPGAPLGASSSNGVQLPFSG